MVAKEMDMTVDLSPKADSGSEHLRKKVYLKVLMPGVIKATILYFIFALATGQV